ncbi:siderophore-interacting protein [Corynebacterium spheniscorum]|uniref:siderophore-interacting protein n=2 Tax=Corynebacterium spheniscorum TaxID=185761 RepID=UPI001689360A|nr:siderophore-interacting protein [Corynebacterium spheniscorum]
MTRQKIIEVGREIGLESLSIKEIARRLNVTPAAIYKRVDSRQALSLLLVDAIFSEVEAPEDEGNLRDYLLRVGYMLFNLYIDNPGLVECSADLDEVEERLELDLTIMANIRNYGFRRDTADALYSSIENLAMGMYFYVSRLQNLLGRDYSIPVGPFRIDAKQTIALMLAPYIDGLLAYFSDPKDLEATVTSIYKSLPAGLIAPLDPRASWYKCGCDREKHGCRPQPRKHESELESRRYRASRLLAEVSSSPTPTTEETVSPNPKERDTAGTPYSDIAPVEDLDVDGELWILTITNKERISETVMRVTLQGDDCKAHKSQGFEEHVVLFFDAPDAGGEVLPEPDGEGGWTYPREGSRLHRHITIRRFRPELGEIDLDFILHDEGFKTEWVKNIPVGTQMRMIGPHGGVEISEEYDRYKILVDEIGFTGVSRWLERTPSVAPKDVFVKIPSASSKVPVPECEGLNLTWLVQDEGDPDLIETMHGFELNDDEATFVGLIAEKSEEEAFDQWMFENHPHPIKHAGSMAYWKMGEEGH